MSLRPGRNKQSLNSAIFRTLRLSNEAATIRGQNYSPADHDSKDQRMPAERHARIHFVKIGTGTDISRTAYGRK
jgi:hypothetical protein